MYQYACKISCSLQCLPLSKGDVPDSYDKLKDMLMCVWDNASKNYGAKAYGTRNGKQSSQQSALVSLYDNYRKKFNLMMKIDSITNDLNAEIINSPLLRKDAATYNKVCEGIKEVDSRLVARHSAGTLYSVTAQQLYDENLISMPQQVAEWYDFSLAT